MERVIARVCREAGATVRFNTMVRDMNVEVKAGDERRIEVLAQGLPLHGVAQLAVDASLRQFALSVEGILVHVPIVRTGPFSSMHVWTRRMLTRSCSRPVPADWWFSLLMLGDAGVKPFSSSVYLLRRRHVIRLH